jgi:hypothetical protein
MNVPLPLFAHGPGSGSAPSGTPPGSVAGQAQTGVTDRM